MDLVKGYVSDMEDDGEEVQELPKAHQEIDIIDLDSDSEVENDRQVTQNKQSGNVTPPEIDCIDLEDSPVKTAYIGVDNSTSEEDSPLKKAPANNDLSDQRGKDSAGEKISEIPTIQTNSGKKIDYLNLEDSDSDEYESTEKDFRTLMDTASVLNEKPSGPEKPTDVSIITDNATDGSVTKQTGKTPTSNSNSSRITPDLIQNALLLKKSLKVASNKTLTETFSLEKNIVSETLSCIFREDSRVIEASQKINVCRPPRQIIQTNNAHIKLITSLAWCIPKYSYLFLSASQDGSIKIWDIYQTNSVQCIKVNSVLNAAKWSGDGGQIVAGGFDKKAFVYDVQTGKRICQYDIYNIVTSIECHPFLEDVFLVGTKNAILGFDLRVATCLPVRTFLSKCEEVLDIAFLDDNEFICSTNIVSHDSADRTIMAWNFSSGALLSNQIYLERFTCPSLKVHPSDSSFIAQTNGNYIAAFSTKAPFKMKDKRYAGHKVAGYGIECDISPDGKYAVSGDVDGSLHFYNYSTTSSVLVTPKRKFPTNRVKWHPVLSSTVICSTHDGQIQIWK